ncbi:MAG: glycerophosphodiester phosphodiesterase [Deltaproteobacteria bacterium]|jgi:glycerophosphoryl diester phosphodiesterase|nr:glycerophosphodiester phosphodiesterase [Deltaproteobacteria bacterium]
MKRLLILTLAGILCLPALAFAAAAYRPAVASHRGASGYLPEHTLEAKAMAHAMGVDYIEQDVVSTKDDVLVVLHDHTLETTTDVAAKFPGRNRKDGSYYAIDFTLAEIKSLLVTERFDSKTGKAVFPGRFPVSFGIDFRVPTLEEEILLIQGLNKSTGKNTGLYVEVKEPAFHEKEGKPIMEATIAMLAKYGYNQEKAAVILQIFDFDAVKKARTLGWKAPLAMLVDMDGQMLVDDKDVHKWLLTEEGVKEAAKYASIYAPWFGHLALPSSDGKSWTTAPCLKWARDAGMRVHTWTHRSDKLAAGFATEKAMFDAMFKEMSLDGLFSDFPDRAIAYLKRNGMRRK